MSLESRIDELQAKLKAVTRELRDAKLLIEHYEKEGHEGWRQYHIAESKIRVFSDMARKFGLCEYNEEMKMETCAALEVRNLSHLPLEKIIDFVDLHSALSRQFAELARSKASELDINETRIKRNKERATAAEERREEPAVKKAQAEKLSEDKAENKALKKLMAAGIGFELAQQMLATMKGK